jgi:LDH2 family malate/lactate/ureidoglycolate dehydrogenase
MYAHTRAKKRGLTALVVCQSSRCVKPLGFVCQNVIGPWPMQLVVPSAVRAAVRMLTIT